MQNKKRNLDLYKVKTQFNINDSAICRIGDLIIVDESAYDGASAHNISQDWGFQPFCEYEKCDKLTSFTLTWDEYMDLIHKAIYPQVLYPYILEWVKNHNKM